MKFKVGDRVRVKSRYFTTTYKELNGIDGIVIDVTDVYIVCFDGVEYTLSHRYLELI